MANALTSYSQMLMPLKLKLWATVAKRYVGERDNLIFELLNEIVEPDSTRWNKLSKKLVDAIENIDKDRSIIIGGNNFNAVSELKNIDVLDNDKIIYTFHFYEPMLFTHQKAPWFEMTRLFNMSQDYPDKFIGIKEFVKNNPNFSWIKNLDNIIIDKSFLEKQLAPAIEFVNKTGKLLYCGEYGVIEIAAMQGRINWHTDFVNILKELKIGRACWSYKLMDFSIVDAYSKVVSKELVKIISMK